MKKIFLMALLGAMFFYNRTTAQVALEINGQPFNDISHPEIEGYPFLVNDWNSGTVLLENNKVIPAALKFNVYTNQVLFKDKTGQELELKNKFNGFTLNNTNPQVSNINPIVFVNGFPATGNQTEASLYQLIADGKVKLLKSYQKKINEDRDYDSSVVTSTYKSYKAYYVYKNGRLTEIRLSKKALLKLFDDHSTQVASYLESNNIDLRSDADLQKLFTWYNSLT